MSIETANKVRVSVITDIGEELEVMTCTSHGPSTVTMEGFDDQQKIKLLNAAYYLKRLFFDGSI